MTTDLKICPFCSEKIQESAIKCKHCGEWLNKKSFLEKLFLSPLPYVICCIFAFLVSIVYINSNSSLIYNINDLFVVSLELFTFISIILISFTNAIINSDRKTYFDEKFSIFKRSFLLGGIISFISFSYIGIIEKLKLNLNEEQLPVYVIATILSLNFAYIIINLIYKEFNTIKNILNVIINSIFTIITIFISFRIFKEIDILKILDVSLYSKNGIILVLSLVVIPIIIIIPTSLFLTSYPNYED